MNASVKRALLLLFFFMLFFFCWCFCCFCCYLWLPEKKLSFLLLLYSSPCFTDHKKKSRNISEWRKLTENEMKRKLDLFLNFLLFSLIFFFFIIFDALISLAFIFLLNCFQCACIYVYLCVCLFRRQWPAFVFEVTFQTGEIRGQRIDAGEAERGREK